MTKLQYYLKKALESHHNSADGSDYYLERLTLYPENEWFSPHNQDGHADFSVCDHLAQWNLIEVQRKPLWNGSGFRGIEVLFRYNLGLGFQKNATYKPKPKPKFKKTAKADFPF